MYIIDDCWPSLVGRRSMYAANVNAIMQSLQWLRASRAVGSQAETRQHKTQLTFGLNFRAASCCFIRDRLSMSVAFMTFISRGVTAESETHYLGITALFSWFVPIPAVITAVTAALPRLQSPCHPQTTTKNLVGRLDWLWQQPWFLAILGSVTGWSDYIPWQQTRYDQWSHGQCQPVLWEIISG